jgi:DNA-binding TFAR19-related protein (PDSD5 family)
LEKNAKETSNEVRRGKKEVSKDKELELLRRQRMARLMNRLQTRKTEEGRKAEDPKKILRRIVTDRAWEVLKAAESQYPKATCRVEEQLAHLVSKGELDGPILGGQLLWLFRRLGMNVRLETRIRILEHEKLKTIGEKLKESKI